MVSIVITYIDEIDFLAEAIESALKQELPEREIIVICNNQELNNDFISRPHGNQQIIWKHEPTPGSAFARNAGLLSASGDWIQFLDVDDLLMPSKITNQSGKSDMGAVVSPHLYRHLGGNQESSKWLSDDIWTGLLNSGLGSTSSMLWNKKALLDVGGWSPDYQSHQEYELLFRLVARGYDIFCVDRKETIVRERKSGSITQQTKPVRVQEGIRLRETMWKYLEEQSLNTPERKKAFLQYIFRQLRGLFLTDPAAAQKTYAKYFSSNPFSPEKNGIPFYALLYHMLGFNRTEQFFQFYRGLRDKYLPFLPKNK